MWFSLSKVYLAQYFELNNIPFGELVYWSVVTLPHFRKDHFSGEICMKIGNGKIFSGPEILLREMSSICGQQVISRTVGPCIYLSIYLFIYLFIYFICTIFKEVYTFS